MQRKNSFDSSVPVSPVLAAVQLVSMTPWWHVIVYGFLLIFLSQFKSSALSLHFCILQFQCGSFIFSFVCEQLKLSRLQIRKTAFGKFDWYSPFRWLNEFPCENVHNWMILLTREIWKKNWFKVFTKLLWSQLYFVSTLCQKNKQIMSSFWWAHSHARVWTYQRRTIALEIDSKTIHWHCQSYVKC